LAARIDVGGMAEVYDAVDRRLRRPVAVKLLRPQLAVQPELRHRFEAEARVAARISHPNVVAVYDTGEDEGGAFMVMERVPGESLGAWLQRGPLNQEWVRCLAEDILAALAAAHQAGVLHRDIKPANILITADGRAKAAPAITEVLPFGALAASATRPHGPRWRLPVAAAVAVAVLLSMTLLLASGSHQAKSPGRSTAPTNTTAPAPTPAPTATTPTTAAPVTTVPTTLAPATPVAADNGAHSNGHHNGGGDGGGGGGGD
jgi:serine/threonine protein kinase